jgi:hypothetical protein
MMTALLVSLLLAASVFDTARLLSARPAVVERQLTRELLAGRVAPALYRHRLEALAHAPRRSARPR